MRRPPLTVDQILAWADAHRRRTGRWPTVNSGRVRWARGESWRGVNNALRLGLRGLPGGSSLALLLARQRAARNRASLPRFTRRLVLSWADEHFARTGSWPTLDSGPVAAAPGETWLAVDAALKNGHRGLPGGDSLGRLLARRRGARNHTNITRLTERKVLAWADAHRAATGSWPGAHSGPVLAAPGETWAGVAGALRKGLRGLPGGTTLYRLLRQRRHVPGPRPAARPAKVRAGGRGRPRLRISFPAELLARYRAGELNTADVARHCGVSPVTAARELRRAGAAPRTGGRPRPRRPAAHAAAVRRYRRGASVPKVAAALGLSRGRVTTILRRCGVARRPAGPDLYDHGLTAAGRARLAARLRSLRRAAGLTQAGLAARCGLSHATVSALEGGRQRPTRRAVLALARALRVRPAALAGGAARG